MVRRDLPPQGYCFIPEPEDDIMPLLFRYLRRHEGQRRHRGIIRTPTAGNDEAGHRSFLRFGILSLSTRLYLSDVITPQAILGPPGASFFGGSGRDLSLVH
jgi:hypothetical protein